jgi:ABC-type phosphate transport system substrate-binding protein
MLSAGYMTTRGGETGGRAPVAQPATRPGASWLRLAALTLLLTLRVQAAAAEGFVVIVNPSVPGTSVHRADLAAVFMKKATRWGDGSPASPVDQSGTSPVRKAFSDSVLQLPVTAVLQYWQRQLLSPSGQVRIPVVKGSDEEVLAYVAKTGGAVGYVAAGVALPPGLKAVTVVD